VLEGSTQLLHRRRALTLRRANHDRRGGVGPLGLLSRTFRSGVLRLPVRHGPTGCGLYAELLRERLRRHQGWPDLLHQDAGARRAPGTNVRNRGRSAHVHVPV